MIAIHNSQIGFFPRWVKYCKEKSIPYKIVDCYQSDIIEQLNGCSALLWHHWQVSYKGWHFDDKISQKYLLEALNLPLVKSYHFVDKNDAIDWASKTEYPKVFKLKSGAGSANVKLARNKRQTLDLIEKAFGRGFSNYDGFEALKERFDKFKQGKDSFIGVLKSIYRVFSPPLYAKMMGRLRFEVYFQEFIPNSDSDIRVIVVGNKAFAIKRLVRKNDFRASGSGNILYEKELFDESLIKKSFEFSKKLGTQVVAFDYVFLNNEPLIVEISYGYAIEGYDKCKGFWDENLNFYPGPFDSTNWIIEDLLKEIN